MQLRNADARSSARSNGGYAASRLTFKSLLRKRGLTAYTLVAAFLSVAWSRVLAIPSVLPRCGNLRGCRRVTRRTLAAGGYDGRPRLQPMLMRAFTGIRLCNTVTQPICWCALTMPG
jgi:hypothetical protein